MNGSWSNEPIGFPINQEMRERLKYSFVFESTNKTNSDQIRTYLLSDICQEQKNSTISKAATEKEPDVEHAVKPECNSFIENYLSIELSKDAPPNMERDSDNKTTTTTTTTTTTKTSIFYQLSLSVMTEEFVNLTKENIDELNKYCPSNTNINEDDFEFVFIGDKTTVLECVNKMIDVLKFSPHIGVGCHELLSEWNPILDGSKFWLEGVSLCVVGLFGLCGNTLAIVVLGSTKDSNR
jgi:hypothetical protein